MKPIGKWKPKYELGNKHIGLFNKNLKIPRYFFQMLT